MSDGTSTQPRRESRTGRKATGTLGRSQLEQSLHHALDMGKDHIREQVRYLLALSQMVPAPNPIKSYARPQLSVKSARLLTLVEMAPELNEQQREALITEIKDIKDIAIRLPLLANLVLHLSASTYRTIIVEIWNAINEIQDPVIRAETLFEVAPFMTLANDEPAAPSALLKIVSKAQSIKNAEARIRSLTALAPRLPYVMAMRIYHRILDDIRTIPNPTLQAKAIVSLSAHLPQDLTDKALRVVQRIANPTERVRASTALIRVVSKDMRPHLRKQVLETMEHIESEEERADALVAFAPSLEWLDTDDTLPKVIESSLAIAITISRKQVRARALVALAPYLTSDLQGEALAIVHSLQNERERAVLLAQLAPNLPPELLVASLAVAHTMREQDARVNALTVLAHHVPDNARSQTLLDALAASSNLPHHFERVGALVNLFDILPDHLLDQALTNALETTRLIDNENARARALNLLGEHLPEKLLLRAMQVVLEIQNPQQRLNALMGIIGNLPIDKRREAMFEMLGCAKQMPLEYKRARALVSIATHLTTDMMDEVEELADSLDDPFDQLSVYIAIVQNIARESRVNIIRKAWSLIREIDDGYDRASAISALATFLPDSAQADIAEQVLAAISIVEDEYDRASAISLLAPILEDTDNDSVANLPDSYTAVQRGIEIVMSLPVQSIRGELLRRAINLWVGSDDKERSYALWQSLVTRLAHLPLPDAVRCLGALLPLIKEFAGEEGVHEVAHILGVR